MADVFISYNQADRDLVRLTAAFLEANGYSVWWDASLLAGDDFQLKILNEVAKARAVIVIWTPNSVKSTWVRSEAGRAQSDHKLVPLKVPGITYDEIPPPFNLLHTEDASNRDVVLLSVKAQMGKSAPTPVLLKSARYELLSWVGVIGAALTLFGNLQSVMQVAKWVRVAAAEWETLCSSFWRVLLFFIPGIGRFDAFAMSLLSFGFMTFYIGSKRGNGAQYCTNRGMFSIIAAAAILSSMFALGFLRIARSSLMTSDRGIIITILSYPIQAFGFNSTNLAVMFAVSIVALPYIVVSMISSKLGIGNKIGYLVAPVILVALFFVGDVIFISGTRDLRSSLVGSHMMVFLIELPILMGFALSVGTAHVLRRSIDLALINTRLWRIIAAIALLTAVNYGMLWLERQPWAAELLK